MQDDMRDEILNKAVEASLAIGEKGPGAESGVGPWKVATPEALETAPSDQSAAGSSSPGTTPVSQVDERPVGQTGSAVADTVTSSGPQKSVPSTPVESHNLTGDNTLKPKGPVGIAIGTSSITLAEGRDKKIHHMQRAQFNATIPFDSLYTNVLYEHEIPYFEMSNFNYVQGYGADHIANFFHTHPWRPVSPESSQDQDGIVLCEAILQTIIGRPNTPATPLYFTVPSPPFSDNNIHAFAKGTLQTFFSRFGYIAMPVEKGVAVAMSELADNNFTGLVVTVGASLCNITLTYLSVPLLSFSLPKAGDYIDTMVAKTTNEFQFKVKEFKEESFSLAAKPATRLERALRIYYEDVVGAIINGLEKALGGRPPANLNTQIPVVLSGGSVQLDGFQELFEKTLDNSRLPLAITNVRTAQDPITAAAKGALFLANSEEL